MPAYLNREMQEAMVERRVLVVDDIPINCKILCTHLSRMSIQTDTAANGEEAVALCMRNRYMVVLMDLDMPVMDGFKATKLIRKYEQSLSIRTPILAVSSFDKPEDRQKCIREGLDGLIVKGVKADELIQIINSYNLEDTISRMPAMAVQRQVKEQLGMSADLAQLQFRFDAKACEIVSEFIMFSRGHLPEFERVIADRNSMELTHVSYAFKGACSNLGLATMASLCAEIADDGYANKWHRVSRKYRSLLEMLVQVQDCVTNSGSLTSRVS